MFQFLQKNSKIRASKWRGYLHAC